MYELIFLPTAKQDMVEIIRYISVHLKNPVAAEKLADSFMVAASQVSEFPYAQQLYYPIRPLEYEYRKISVGNYLMFYRTEEETKHVIIVRVLYGKRNYDKVLDKESNG